MQRDTHFYEKIPFLKEFWVQLSKRLKNYMPDICQNVHKVNYQGAEGKSFFKFLNKVEHWS